MNGYTTYDVASMAARRLEAKDGWKRTVVKSGDMYYVTKYDDTGTLLGYATAVQA